MLMLPKLWKHLEAEHRLTSDCFVVLSFFLCDRPGRVVYQGRRYGVDDPRKVRARPGLAEELGWDRLRVHRAIKLLRECGLLRVETFRRREALSKLNLSTICRYDVAIEMLERGALDEPPGGSPDEPPCDLPDPSISPTPTPSSAPRRARRAHAPSGHRVEHQQSSGGDAAASAQASQEYPNQASSAPRAITAPAPMTAA